MNTTMIGRNDPCPCGSGKKYKKCHGAKNSVDLNEVIENELTSIIRKYVESPREKADRVELEQFYQTWSSALTAAVGKEAAEQLTLGYYLFSKRNDWWQSFLSKQKGHRPAVQETLEDWTNPIPVIGQVLEVKDGYLHVIEILSGNQYSIPSDIQPEELPQGAYCTGVLLPEKRKGENVYTYTLSLEFLQPFLMKGEGAMKEMAESTNLTVEEFYRQYYLDALLVFVEAAESLPELSSDEKTLLEELEEFVKGHGELNPVLLKFFEAYLISKKPNPRKKSALVAAAVRFGKESGLLPNEWTNKELGEHFSVSTSTIQRYSEEMVNFFEIVFSETEGTGSSSE